MEQFASDNELHTKPVSIEQKLFYLDLKENVRGRYLKIAEKASGSRSIIIVPEQGIEWFVELFEYYSKPDSQLESKELQLPTKVFYFDVGENARGRFLKVSEASVSRNRSTIIVPAGVDASGWALFRDGLVEIRDVDHMIASSQGHGGHAGGGMQQPTQQQVPQQAPPPHQVGAVNNGYRAAPAMAAPNGSAGRGRAIPNTIAANTNVANHAKPPPMHVPQDQHVAMGGPDLGHQQLAHVQMGGAGAQGGLQPQQQQGGEAGAASTVVRAEQKRFFFDMGVNARGQFLRISEVVGSDRSAIIVPASALEQFYQTLGGYVESAKKAGGARGAGAASVRTIAALRKRPEHQS